VPAILYHTRDLFFLGDGDLPFLLPGSDLTDFDWQPVQREFSTSLGSHHGGKGWLQALHAQGIYEHHAPSATPRWTVSFDTGKVFLEQMDVSDEEFRNLRK